MSTTSPCQVQPVSVNVMPDEYFIRVRGTYVAIVELHKYKNAKRKRSRVIRVCAAPTPGDIQNVAELLWESELEQLENAKAIRKAVGDYPPKKWSR